MKELIDYSKAITNYGDLGRLQELFKKAKEGGHYNLVFLGGSITQGSVASTPETCYAYRTYAWFKENFPKADFSYFNAGIGGTTSHLGTARCESDVLSHNPDFVIVEFSVNDSDEDFHFAETYEGLVRRILVSETKPAVLIVHSVRYDDGGNAEDYHGAIGRYYGVPCVSMQKTIYPLVESGQIKNREITPDDLHPNDAGHELVASVITYALGELAGAKSDKTVSYDCLPLPITPNAYEGCRRYQNTADCVALDGFTSDTAPEQPWNHFKKGWTADKKGASITFTAEGECFAVQYRKTVKKPAPIATCIIDGDREHATVLDGNFEETWGDCLYLETIVEHGKYVTDGAILPARPVHEVRIEITEVPENAQNDFYLLSLITSGAEAKKEDRFACKEMIKIAPEFKQRIWGGRLLESDFGYDIPDGNIGECWAISAHPNGDAHIDGGTYGGYTLSSLYKEHRELFGGRCEQEFPLLIKIIDASADLSVQVHPDDAYARAKENVPYGKTECWYIIDCKEDADIVFGHNAQSRDELTEMVKEGKWTDLLRTVKIKKGDFLQIEPGTIHAIKGGTMILETQQSSDITYRVYDYDRLENGKPRQLHVAQSIDVANIPGDKSSVLDTLGMPKNTLNELVSCKYYTVYKVVLDGEMTFDMAWDYMLFSVLDGELTVNGEVLTKGAHVILPSGYGMTKLSGNAQLILSRP